MKKLSKLALLLGASLLSCNVALASNQPTTFIGPTLQAGYTSTINDYTAYSLLGEAGVKNFRANGTLGWKLQQNQYVKLSAEYLWQDIAYRFFSGSTTQWVQQGAVGAGYMYEFLGYAYEPHIDVTAYYSHAPDKSVGAKNGLFSLGGGVFVPFVDHRHIAGSNGAGITPSVSVAPWEGARAGLGLNYDNVRYTKKFPRNEDAKGLGGTITFNQIVTPDISFGLAAAVRQPFNNYYADVKFANLPYVGRWVLDIDGDYTAGKNTLPNTWNIGLSGHYSLDNRVAAAPMFKDMGYKDRVYKDMQPVKDDLLEYTADPAVYMPQVLAIPDENLVPSDPKACTALPSLTGAAIASATLLNQSSQTIPSAQAFASPTPLTFSVAVSPAPQAGNSVTIDPSTGVITATDHTFQTGTQTLTVTVTAKNACGLVRATTQITMLGAVI
jgi:hypothetical protein